MVTSAGRGTAPRGRAANPKSFVALDRWCSILAGGGGLAYLAARREARAGGDDRGSESPAGGGEGIYASAGRTPPCRSSSSPTSSVRRAGTTPSSPSPMCASASSIPGSRSVTYYDFPLPQHKNTLGRIGIGGLRRTIRASSGRCTTDCSRDRLTGTREATSDPAECHAEATPKTLGLDVDRWQQPASTAARTSVTFIANKAEGSGAT